MIDRCFRPIGGKYEEWGGFSLRLMWTALVCAFRMVLLLRDGIVVHRERMDIVVRGDKLCPSEVMFPLPTLNVVINKTEYQEFQIEERTRFSDVFGREKMA